MRTLRLARTALEAEGLILKRQAWQVALRVIFLAIALLFLGASLVMLHLVLYLALQPHVPPIGAAGILLGGDLFFVLIFALLALKGSPDPIAHEARMVRDQARAELAGIFTTAATLAPLAKRFGLTGILGALLTGAIANIVALWNKKT
ncbi:Hypothetical protein GbCGDNIH9_1814 [Granulibacter bethesdensis]|uniref:Phage holin family protein n=1 Tax=Granulibacter bethesdensis TaxID=364410 RepID=A0AAC9KB96_9PROT|nr:hypothetical protein [Granulibacter bethesdensis]APH55124.1 Hypothetical protein GbCGDNIH9_1814 [Granulibacter bethesdensis]APH62709.1 Hypothetical protein GbCGDNIH8_1814 [Granulibacter bethesdensis]